MSALKKDPIREFTDERADAVKAYPADTSWQQLSNQWLQRAFQQKYMYNFAALGRPIIQLPADIVVLQEVIWDVKPDLIIETGIAHGGSIIWSAAMLALLDYCEAAENGTTIDPRNPKRKVLGIDIDIRAHNRAAIEAHPMASRIDMMQGSSIDAGMIKNVHDYAKGKTKILVLLDSNHTHDHVLAELEAYAPLTSKGSYCIVYDTLVEDLPADAFPDRPWSPGDNPKTALHAYLKKLAGSPAKGVDGQPLVFEIDKAVENKLLLSVAPDGFLKRV